MHPGGRVNNPKKKEAAINEEAEAFADRKIAEGKDLVFDDRSPILLGLLQLWRIRGGGGVQVGSGVREGMDG